MLVAYEIINEPLVRSSVGKLYTPKDWLVDQEIIVAEVRSYDKNRYVVVNAGLWELSFTILIPTLSKDCMLEIRYYKYSGIISGQLWNKAKFETVLEPLVKFKNENNILVWRV